MTIRRGWMSFADGEKPPGQQLLGACVVEITDEEIEIAREKIAREWPGREHDAGNVFVGACIYVSFRDGVNPGHCDVAVAEMPDWAWAEMEASGVKPSRLLTREQLEEFAVKVSSLPETLPGGTDD